MSNHESSRTGPSEVQAWVEDGIELGQRSAEIGRQLQRDWDAMALDDRRSWSTDTVMNEMVNSWEHVTPVLGDWIQHSLNGAGIALRTMWPTAGQQLRTVAESARASTGEGGAAPYLDASASAADRLVQDRYTSADAVEDMANLYGKFTKDSWAAAARARSKRPSR